MIANDQEYRISQERIGQFHTRLAELARQSAADPALATARAGAASILAELEREAAMWEAGIREPVPGTPERVPPPWTSEEVNAMSGAEYERASRQATALLKRAEIAQIDRAIAEALDRIADWRRHRAWLEREIAALEAPATVSAVR